MSDDRAVGWLATDLYAAGQRFRPASKRVSGIWGPDDYDVFYDGRDIVTENPAYQYAAMRKGRRMLRSLVILPVTILLLASASNTATAARVCIAGRFHYGGSGLHHDRVHAQASAVRAWRAIQAESHGARPAANMYPASNQIHCKHGPGNEGWRCFVRGGPCHTI